jgi:hypothetical protein
MLSTAAQQAFSFCSADVDCGGEVTSSVRTVPTTLTLEARDALTLAKLSGAVYRIYTDFSSAWNGCSGSAYGLLVALHDSAASGDVAVVPDGKDYLIVASGKSYYTAWTTSLQSYNGATNSFVDLGGGFAFTKGDVKMIRMLKANEQCLVLRWFHATDLHLWVMDDSNPAHCVGQSNRIGFFGGGNISLDLLSVQGAQGPESSVLRSALSPGSKLSVWVHSSDMDFSLDMIIDYPASVDV